MNEKDKATAQTIAALHTSSSRLRSECARQILKALTTVRQEAWRKVFDVVSAEGGFGARQLIKSLEAARETDGYGPSQKDNEHHG